ncbi:MAG TPA: DUF3460 family protein [Noviherbaspirillum sp.]|nr:DUF3460 family protein [Noviherbaspirillum sp.]
MKFSKQQTRYQSEFTNFLNDMKSKDPGIEERQREGRALLWDKAPLDLDATKRARESRVKQQPYVYQSK